MRAFAEAYPDPEIVQQLLHNCPWGHHVVLLDRISTQEERLWYATQAVQYGWSRNVLIHHIAGNLYRRQGRAITNFVHTLPAPQSDLAQDLTRDHYNFAFLSLGQEAVEREIEDGLIAHFRDFFRELGTGFAFIGNQYRLAVGQSEVILDLLFYHVRLHSYIVIEIKVGEFTAAHAGQMALYIEAIDRQLRDPHIDGPTIGIILCGNKDDILVEMSLSGVAKPVGVGTYHHGEGLPESVAAQLPEAQILKNEFVAAKAQLRRS
jgi:predicted nuclease of restriction endonuclease-like (RecB) superfamily